MDKNTDGFNSLLGILIALQIDVQIGIEDLDILDTPFK